MAGKIIVLCILIFYVFRYNIYMMIWQLLEFETVFWMGTGFDDVLDMKFILVVTYMIRSHLYILSLTNISTVTSETCA
jgi:hypothetical protein